MGRTLYFSMDLPLVVGCLQKQDMTLSEATPFGQGQSLERQSALEENMLNAKGET